MPIGPKQGQEKCKKLAKPLIEKIDKSIKENDEGQRRVEISFSQVKVSKGVFEYLSHVYEKAGWKDVEYQSDGKGQIAGITLVRDFF
jgi:hypothetical protein